MRDHFEYNRIRYIQYGIFYEMMIMSINPYAIKFLTRLGGTSFDISLFNAMRGIFMVLIVFPGVLLVERKKNKKKVISKLVIVISLVSLSYSLVPFAPKSVQPLVFIMLSATMMIPLSIYNSCYQSFTGTIFPLRRSEVIAKRNMFVISFITTFVLLSGLMFRYFAHSNDDYILIYQGMFVLSFIFGMISVNIFNTFYYVPTEEPEKVNLKKIFNEIISNKRFLRFVIASTAFHFGWQMGWPLFSIYMVKTLKADELWLAIIRVGSSIVMVLGHRKWPGYIEKYGIERITTVVTFGMAITPILHALSPNLPTLAVIGSISGLFTSGTLTVLLADLLEVTPEKNRTVYLGFYNTLTNLTLATSPFVGHFFLSGFNIYVALIATAVFRAIGSLAFLVRERKNVRLEES